MMSAGLVSATRTVRKPVRYQAETTNEAHELYVSACVACLCELHELTTPLCTITSDKVALLCGEVPCIDMLTID